MLIIEIISIILFIVYLVHAWRQSQMRFFLLALVYAILMENLSVLAFAGQAGGYYYNSDFLFFLYKTPLFVVLLWPIILYSSYEIIKKISPGRQAIFLAPLYVLILDIVLDQVATALGFWTWIGFEGYNGIFSVPASNYIGWLVLPFFFYLTYEKLKSSKFLVFQPFLTYFLFIVFSLPLHFLKINFFDDNVYIQYLILFLIIFSIAFLAYFKYEKNENKGPLNYQIFLVRVFLHIFSLFGIIYLWSSFSLFLLIIFLPIVALELYIFFEYKKTAS